MSLALWPASRKENHFKAREMKWECEAPKALGKEKLCEQGDFAYIWQRFLRRGSFSSPIRCPGV